MNKAFYIGAIGAHQQLKHLTLHGNNLANVNTYGFKTVRGRFADLMYSDIKATDEKYLPSGVGVALWTTDADFREGLAVTTGGYQDYKIEGDGFFALADLNTGEISLTRGGSFVIASLQRPTDEMDEMGQPVMEEVFYLSDGEGRFVLSKTGGMIEIEDRNAELPVGVFDYINYNGMEHLGDTRFLATDKNGGIRLGEGKAVHGMLEASNVDLATEMTKVIETQRAYSMALKMVQTSDEIETIINSLRS